MRMGLPLPAVLEAGPVAPPSAGRALDRATQIDSGPLPGYQLALTFHGDGDMGRSKVAMCTG